MVYLEMSRDPEHGGGAWAFLSCLWAPTKKANGSSWPYWTKLLQVKRGDTVLHLRGVPPEATFVGYSQASSDGFVTTERPPHPGAWGYSASFFRVDLEGFVPLHTPVNLSAVFSTRRAELAACFDRNKAKSADKLNIFFVRQGGRLQCLNGAYLSDVDASILEALFGSADLPDATAKRSPLYSVETGSQLAIVGVRLGQDLFSKAIRQQYGGRCCFPSCSVADPRFLVASHIARWSENEALRGHLGNGLCLCLMHDKAFELGLFTLDEDFRVFVSPRESMADSAIARELHEQHGQMIRLAPVLPLGDALLEHWSRTNVYPG